MPTVTRTRYDALLLDLDGTLLDGQGAVSDRVRSQVRRLADLGYRVVLATGRSPAGTRDVHRDLALDTELVCYNGAWIGMPDGFAPYHCATIPDDLVGAVGGAEARAAFLFRHHGDAKYTPRSDHPQHTRLQRWFTNVVVLDRGDSGLPERDLLRVSLFFDDLPSADAVWSALPALARDRLHREVFPMSLFPEFTDVGLVLLEIQRRGRGKAEAFRLLEDRYGVPADRVVAVGDHMNDLPMLEGAGLAVAMGNGVPEAQAAADIVIGDHREDGLARWMEAEVA